MRLKFFIYAKSLNSAIPLVQKMTLEIGKLTNFSSIFDPKTPTFMVLKAKYWSNQKIREYYKNNNQGAKIKKKRQFLKCYLNTLKTKLGGGLFCAY